MKEKLAIIGSGIAGLGAAYHLSDHYDITVFEKNKYLGGHTNTVEILEKNQTINIDTGFIVFNKETYPNLLQFLKKLNVPYQPGKMSFSVYNKNTNLQYSGKSLGDLFAQRPNVFKPRHWKLVYEINQFTQQAPIQLETKKVDLPLAEYLRSEGYSDDFMLNFILPMGAAVWSTPIDKMLNFPAKTLIRFFYNHGFLGLNTQYQWYTVTNGAKRYIEKICGVCNFRYKMDCPVYEIERLEDQVAIKTKQGNVLFDKVIVATHADQALALLKNPQKLEKELLAKFKYEKNQAILHTDASLMPPLKKVWSAWNYKTINDKSYNLKSSIIYYMNFLQDLKTEQDYFISINEFDDIDPQKIYRTIDYEHPIFDMETMIAQNQLGELNKNNQIFYCGSYFKYGFHEDAFTSALNLSKRLLERHEIINV